MDIEQQHIERNDNKLIVASRHSRPGQVIIMFALFIFVLLGIVALAIDAGFLMAERRQAQSAADGAAMAADKAYQRNEIGNIVPTGVNYAAELDASDSIEPAHVTITPYASYTVNGVSYIKCVEAFVEHNVTPFFVGLFVSPDTWSVSAEAVACTEPVDREYALIAIDENGDGIASQGTADMEITGGGAMSNADFNLCGSVNWDQGTGVIDAGDGISTCNNVNITSGDMNPRADPLTDPLATMAEPRCAGLPTYDDPNPAIPYPLPGGEPDVFVTATDPLVQVYGPGNYPDGIRIRHERDVLFEPGLYCLGGLGLSLSAGSSQNLNAVGDDVMFYMYGNAPVNINGQGVNVNLSNIDGNACSQAACQASIIFYYSRGIISGQPIDCSDFVLNGNIVTVEGIIYTPCSSIRLAGNGRLTITGQLIGAEIFVAGGNQVTINYDSGIVTAPAQVYLVQ